MWNFIKRNAGWVKSLSPKIISENGVCYTNPTDIANQLNNYFISKVTKIVSELEVRKGDPTKLLRNLWNKWRDKDRVEIFKFKPVTEARVKIIFNQLKNTHLECMDGFSNKIIKIAAPSLIKPMKHLINSCFKTNIFPSKWKIFKLIGLYKNKGEIELLKNYRPIALLNPLSKVLEVEMYYQMNSHMDKYKMWNKNGYAYKKHHSTIHALMDLAEIWCSNIDSNTQNVNMMLDMSCAFDLVSHNTLREKMKIYKYDKNSIKLILSYLSFRSQYVDICGKKSNYLWKKHGVPQGSIMGHFYLVYM